MTNKKSRDISCVDLFCGAGGLTHGLVNSGVKVTAGIDLDPACRYPFEVNNPGAQFVEKSIDKRLPTKKVASYFVPGTVRVLAGCAPCQPFSTYSHRYDNQRDGKWELLKQFGRFVKGIEPEIVTMENVPAIQRHPVFESFLRILERREYFIWHDTVDCAEYGVPQARKRTVLLASKYGPITMIEPTHEKALTVKKTIGRLPPLCAGETDRRDKLHTACGLSPKNLKRIRHSIPGGTWRDWPKRLVADCHRQGSGKTYPSVYGRMEWGKPAPTMTTQCYGFGNGRFGHPEQDRAISLREAAMLQSFPREYKFVPDDRPVEFNPIGRLIGNAVPVKLGEAIGTSIILHIKSHL